MTQGDFARALIEYLAVEEDETIIGHGVDMLRAMADALEPERAPGPAPESEPGPARKEQANDIDVDDIPF